MSSQAKNAPPPELPLFRFGLRHLLWFVAAASTFLAVFVSLRGIPALALLLAALVVAFHLLSTALGSQLRLHANRARESRIDPVMLSDSLAGTPGVRPRPLAPGMSQVSCFGRGGESPSWLPRLVATSMFFGGCLGTLLLTAIIGHRSSPAGFFIGALSLAALSGWFAFLAGRFYAIVRRGLSEARAAEEPDAPSPTIRR